MRALSYDWHLRQVMANRGLFTTTSLSPLLAERGVHLSPAQVHRLVTQVPERLSLKVLVALCDALECTSTDLIEPQVIAKPKRATAGANRSPSPTSTGSPGSPVPVSQRRPRRADIVSAPTAGPTESAPRSSSGRAGE